MSKSCSTVQDLLVAVIDAREPEQVEDTAARWPESGGHTNISLPFGGLTLLPS
jgi:hypothetical protein